MTAGFGFPTALDSTGGGLTGDPIFFEGISTLSDGSEVTLISEATPVGKIRNAVQVFLSCPFAGKMTVLKGASTIGVGRTAPGSKNVYFSWQPLRPIGASETVTVKFEVRDGAPTVSVEAFLMLTEVDV